MEGTHENDNDTWSTLGLAAARVLIKATEQKRAREQQGEDREHTEAEHDAERAKRSSIPLVKKKLMR